MKENGKMIKRNGKGVAYYENGNKEYEGEWKDGNKTGYGFYYYLKNNTNYCQLKYDQEIIFTGEWKNDMIQIDSTLFIEIEDDCVIINEIRKTGFFGCVQKNMKYTINITDFKPTRINNNTCSYLSFFLIHSTR